MYNVYGAATFSDLTLMSRNSIVACNLEEGSALAEMYLADDSKIVTIKDSDLDKMIQKQNDDEMAQWYDLPLSVRLSS